MRKTVVVAAVALLGLAACVQSQTVPNIIVFPTSTPTPAAPPMFASPAALTLSASALVPPFPVITVSQPGAMQPPNLILASSTCINNNNIILIASFGSGFSNTFQVQAISRGSCVLVFGGIGGVQLIVPVTILP